MSTELIKSQISKLIGLQKISERLVNSKFLFQKITENLKNLTSDSLINEIQVQKSDDTIIESIDNSEVKNSFNCMKCGFKTHFQSMFRRHELKHSNEKLLKCNKCKKRFRFLNHLKVHQLVHKSIHSAVNPFKRLVKRRKLNPKIAEKVVNLDLISVSVIDEKEVRRSDVDISESSEKLKVKKRLNTIKPKLKSDFETDLKSNQKFHINERQFECKQCLKRFQNSSNLRRHLLIHSNEKPYECKDCKKSFRQIQHLRVHQLIHSNEMPYNCHKCGKQFRQLSHLKTHQLIHSNDKPYECKDCKKSFRQITHLRDHQLIHINGKPFECKECSKRFRHSYSLKIHQLFHSNKRQFVCDWSECGKRFNIKSELNRHKRCVHLNEKKFECDYKDCKKRFINKLDLIRHKRIHSGEKPFICDHKNCDKRFSQKSSLNRHIKAIHLKQN